MNAPQYLRVGLQSSEHAKLKKLVSRGAGPQQVVNAFPLHNPNLIMGSAKYFAEELGLIARRVPVARAKTEEEIRKEIMAETENNRAALLKMEEASSVERKEALKLEQENQELKIQLAAAKADNAKPAEVKPAVAAKPVVKAVKPKES